MQIAQRAHDEHWMDRALELARMGEAQVSPNPMVGAVVVKNGRAVGEAFHTYEGLRHAEILALDAAGPAARGATLYVNLEPCCHTGRTGPCTDAILAAGVRQVVVAAADPNPAVAGRGIKQLRAGGLRVRIGVRQAEARRLNEAFCRWISTGRPLVTLKSALTLDGHVALPRLPGRPQERWITSVDSRAEVQRMRRRSDAVLTGIGTVLSDDPLLTDRTGRPRRRRLLRVVVDSRLRLPPRSKLVRSIDRNVLVFTTQSPESARARALRRAGVEVVRVRSRANRPDLGAVIEDLGRREILSVMLEAGPRLNWAALEAGIVDKVVLFYAPKIAGADHLPVARGRPWKRAPTLRNISLYRLGGDFAVEGYLRDVYRNR
jgi:diaminohydroxyphosphoribosylaminopyrimidine deaminase/5-amino-6-(5-phosphoribosylamino)uracil reductase